MNDEQIAADLNLLEREVIPQPRDLDGESDRIKVRVFLKDLDIRPGPCPGVEVCSLYRYFKYWLRWVDRKARLTHRNRFARLISAAGFVHDHRTKAGGVDRRLLGMRKDSADRVREWLGRHPDTPEERAEFHVRKEKA